MLEMEDLAAFTTGSVPRAKQRFQETWKDSVHVISYSAFTPQVLPESTKVLLWHGILWSRQSHQPIQPIEPIHIDLFKSLIKREYECDHET